LLTLHYKAQYTTRTMFKFNRTYFVLAVILLVVEFIIGAFMHDDYIRPFGGDFLVVILIYCSIKSILKCDVTYTALGVLLFAFVIEWCQRIHLINMLNLQHSPIARVILGTDFAWTDMLMYTLGILCVWLTERVARSI
jgi:hypothetical protein